MFLRRRQTRTVILDRTSALMSNSLSVSRTWQPRHSAGPVMKTIGDSIVISTDPLDRAFSQHLQDSGSASSTQQALHQLDFDQTGNVSGNIWHHGAQYAAAIKGLPEQVLELCDLSDNERESIMLQLQAMSGEGAYIVALARGMFDRALKSVDHLKPTEKLTFIGLVSLNVTVPSATKQLLTTLQNRGVHPYIMTGQHPAAGLHLGQQLGLAKTDRDVFDARQIDVMNDQAIFDTLRRVSVIARADTAQKKHLTRLLLQLDKTTVSIDNLDALRHIVNSK